MKKTVKGLSILLLAGLVMAFAGCSASEDTSETPAAEVSVEITSTVTQVYKGFNGGKITLTASVKNATDSTVTWSSSNEAAATVDSDGVVTAVSAGDATITATASGKTASVEITVKEASVGDIIYTTDGGNTVDIVDSNSYTSEEGKTPVAVVAGFSESGNVLGLGLKMSDTCVWATEGTTGYTTSFSKIISTPSSSYPYTFEGDKDGSDNWGEICKVDTNAETNIAKYPPFNFAVNYGTTTCSFDSTSKLASGWYVPSIYELWQVCQNKATLLSILKKATNNDNFSFAVAYWSSSQSSKDTYRTHLCKFSDGSLLADYGKNYNGVVVQVLVVRQF